MFRLGAVQHHSTSHTTNVSVYSRYSNLPAQRHATARAPDGSRRIHLHSQSPSHHEIYRSKSSYHTGHPVSSVLQTKNSYHSVEHSLADRSLPQAENEVLEMRRRRKVPPQTPVHSMGSLNCSPAPDSPVVSYSGSSYWVRWIKNFTQTYKVNLLYCSRYCS